MKILIVDDEALIRSVIKEYCLNNGYETDEACKLLKQNRHMIASFSRALLQNLFAYQSEEEFNESLKNAIDEIYDASI